MYIQPYYQTKIENTCNIQKIYYKSTTMQTWLRTVSPNSTFLPTPFTSPYKTSIIYKILSPHPLFYITIYFSPSILLRLFCLFLPRPLFLFTTSEPTFPFLDLSLRAYYIYIYMYTSSFTITSLPYPPFIVHLSICRD